MIALSKKRTKIERWTEAEIDKMIELRQSGETLTQIAEKFGRTRHAVKNKLKELRKKEQMLPPLEGRPGYETRDKIADMDWLEILNDIEDCRQRGRLVHYGVRNLDMSLETLIVLTPSERRGFIQRAVDKIEEIERSER
jgi:predicted transcriptional regulator